MWSRTSSGFLRIGNGHPERHSALLENLTATFARHKPNFSVLSIIGVIPQSLDNCGDMTKMCGTDQSLRGDVREHCEVLYQLFRTVGVGDTEKVPLRQSASRDTSWSLYSLRVYSCISSALLSSHVFDAV